MQRTIQLPDGRTATYEDVPITVTEAGLRARAAKDYPDAFRGTDPSSWVKQGKVGAAEDVGRSFLGGAVKGVLEGADTLWRKAPTGLAMMGLDALGAKDALSGVVEYSKGRDERAGKVVSGLGGNYRPQTDVGRYTFAGAQGAGGAVSGGGLNPWQLAMGGLSGLGVQGAEDANLGAAAQLAAAFGLPLAATAARRTLFPKLGYDEVQSAMGVPQRKWYDMGPDQPMRDANMQLEKGQQIAQQAQQQGLSLLPAQAIQQPYAPQSGIINLQNRITPTTAGQTHIKPALDVQAAQANSMVDNILALAREGGKYQTDLDAARGMYQMIGQQPLTAAQRTTVVRALRNSDMYRTRGTDQQRYIARLIDMLENQGTATIPGGPTVTQTQAQSGRSQVPLLGVQQTPPQQVQLPASTQGQLLDVRGQATKGFPDTPGLGQVQRTQARNAINQGRSPEVAAIDAQFAPAQDKANFVQRLDEAAAAARNTTQDLSGGTGADFARRVRGAPGSSTRQEWQEALNPVQFENQDTGHRIAQQLALLERTGYGRAGTRHAEPNEYGQARSSAASVGTAAAGLSGQRRLLASLPWVNQKMLNIESTALAKALADPTGRRLAKLLNYNPNDEMARNILMTMGIGYGLENQPSGE